MRGEVGSGKLESPVLQPPIIHERTIKSIKLRVLQPRHRYTNTNTNNTNSSYRSCNDYDSACKLPLAASAGGDDTFPLMCLSRPPFVSHAASAWITQPTNVRAKRRFITSLHARVIEALQKLQSTLEICEAVTAPATPRHVTTWTRQHHYHTRSTYFDISPPG